MSETINTKYKKILSLSVRGALIVLSGKEKGNKGAKIREGYEMIYGCQVIPLGWHYDESLYIASAVC